MNILISIAGGLLTQCLMLGGLWLVMRGAGADDEGDRLLRGREAEKPEREAHLKALRKWRAGR